MAAAYSYFLRPTHREVRTNEGLKIAIEYAIDVADFFLGAVILHHAVGLQHVGPDLRSEIDIELRVLDFFCGFALLLEFQLIQLRAQHAHGTVAVLMLGTLILATRDQPGRNVGDRSEER